MAITNQERVTKVLELLKDGLRPFVERELKAKLGAQWESEVKAALSDRRPGAAKAANLDDVAIILTVMDKVWGRVFADILGRPERTLVLELIEFRNRWAHQAKFSGDDTDRALDSAERLLTAVSAEQADEVRKAKLELRRVNFDEQARSERRKSASVPIESQAANNLTPWREVVSPHRDVASGRYQQAEFAADLWQVHLGEGTDEYRDPVEFFRRTYLTQSLHGLLEGGVRRLTGAGGDPVVQLQTNFGGGKTHSMLALYHLCSGRPLTEFPGLEPVLEAAEASAPIKAKRVVLVGNKISPGNPSTKSDGTVVRTLWGELAWQLGGKDAFKRVQADDERGTSPGDMLRELFNEYGPCLILIDEWVAYARQLHDQSDLPGGTFETQFSFAQALTESAKLAKNCLLVISLPASDTAGSPHTQATSDVEVGGQRGREALERLRNVVGRVESSWRPATAEEGFEIVRRRLFEPLLERRQFTERDNVTRAFYDLYRTQPGEFPAECGKEAYHKRLKDAYPIHPEVFDRLYGDWSTLVKFQRTRGVLRLMAAVIHSLWEKSDRNPMVLPCHLSIDDPRVQSELTRYLSDNWAPIIEKDVDGPQSVPLRIDSEVPNLGKYHATRRVARTIYLGSAPTAGAANKGIEDRWIKLGCVIPGEQPAVFGDALRRLAAAATYLYEDKPRFWYSVQPTVAKVAEDRAEQLKRDADKVHLELESWLRRDLQQTGDFARVHRLPKSGHDVADDFEVGLVVLEPEQWYAKDGNTPAEIAAKAVFESRGNAPRLYRNTLVFLVADRTRWQDLEEGLRRCIAWRTILDDVETLQLSPHQVRQAKAQSEAAEAVVKARLPETYQWLLVPVQPKPTDPIAWEAVKLTGAEPLAVRASKKLKSGEHLITNLGAVRLRMELDRIPLWRGDHVSISQLIEDFGRYLYLPRLAGPDVLTDAIASGIGLITWSESFAYAESFDQQVERYRGLQAGRQVAVRPDDPGLLVVATVARRQMGADLVHDTGQPPQPSETRQAGVTPPTTADEVEVSPSAKRPTRFHGTVELDPERVGRDAGRVAEEVIAHLNGLVRAQVRITLEIEAAMPDGASEALMRTVTENSRTLHFRTHSFEVD